MLVIHYTEVSTPLIQEVALASLGQIELGWLIFRSGLLCARAGPSNTEER